MFPRQLILMGSIAKEDLLWAMCPSRNDVVYPLVQVPPPIPCLEIPFEEVSSSGEFLGHSLLALRHSLVQHYYNSHSNMSFSAANMGIPICMGIAQINSEVVLFANPKIVTKKNSRLVTVEEQSLVYPNLPPTMKQRFEEITFGFIVPMEQYGWQRRWQPLMQEEAVAVQSLVDVLKLKFATNV